MKIVLTIDTTDIDTMELGSQDVHWRIIKHEGIAKVACVQEFDYIDYAQFVGQVCFVNEGDAERVADKINMIGIKHFV